MTYLTRTRPYDGILALPRQLDRWMSEAFGDLQLGSAENLRTWFPATDVSETPEELTLRLTPAASAFLVDHGYDEHYGARPLKRAIQKYLQDPLALKLLAGEFREGDHVAAEVGKGAGELIFRKK